MPVSPVCPKAKGCTEHMQDDVTAEIFFVFVMFVGSFVKPYCKRKDVSNIYYLLYLLYLIFMKLNILRWTNPFSVIAFERKGNNYHDTLAVFFRMWSLFNQMKYNLSFTFHRHREIQCLVFSLTFKNLRQ